MTPLQITGATLMALGWVGVLLVGLYIRHLIKINRKQDGRIRAKPFGKGS